MRGDLDLQLVVSRLGFVPDGATFDPFLDIDCVDTQSREQSSCLLPEGPLREPVLDGPGGTDSAFNYLMADLLGIRALGYEQRRVSMVLDARIVAPPADTRVVTLAARTAFNHVPSTGGSCEPWPDLGPDGGPTSPDDRWCTDSPQGESREIAEAAWIEGSGVTLKARFATLQLPIALAPPGELADAGRPIPDLAHVRLHDARISATLAGAPGSFTLRGKLVGVVAAADFIETLVGIRQCARDKLPSALTDNLSKLCALRDLSQLGDRDSHCDSYSVALTFEAYQVREVVTSDAYTYAECAAQVAETTPAAVLNVPSCDAPDSGAPDSGSTDSGTPDEAGAP